MSSPPRVAEILLRRFLPSGVVGRSILGDLRREFGEICRSRSRHHPRLWYWHQAVRLSGWYAWSRIRGSAELPRVAVGKENTMLFNLARDVRYAVRRLARARGFTVTTLVTLALGIGVTAAIFALVNAVLIRPLPYRDASRLVAIRHMASRVELAGTGLSDGLERHYREHNRVFEEIGSYEERDRIITDSGEPEQIRGASISPSVLRALRATPYLGRLLTDAERVPGTPRRWIISYDLWVRRFGADPNIIGRTIEIQRGGGEVVGVMEPGFHFPHAETHVWYTSWSVGSKASLQGLVWNSIARLKPGVSREDAERDLQRLVRTLPDAFPDVTAQQLQDMGLRAIVVPFKDMIVRDVRVVLLLLMGTAAFLLLITWANATNLTLVRAESQRREVAVERALGATDGRLARRCFTESSLLAVIGGLLGLAIAHVAVEARFGFALDEIPRLREVAVDGTVVGVVVGLSLLSAGLLGVVSLLGARRTDLSAALTGSSGRMTTGRREQTGRQLLVAGQVA
ncbi:MAG: ABC transporter permease, partial [Gemmatimonadetes bacterium]|nr:ABC transporter permease [Gemmatimonadota bacterium]